MAEVRAIVVDTFEISDEEAQEHAIGLVLLAEGWGGTNTPNLNWAYIVRKKFADKLKWKSETDRMAFFADRQSGYDAYENYIQKNKRH